MSTRNCHFSMFEDSSEAIFSTPLQAEYSPFHGQIMFQSAFWPQPVQGSPIPRSQPHPQAQALQLQQQQAHYAMDGVTAAMTSGLCHSMSAGSGIPGRKASTPRIRLSPSQTSILEDSFQQNPKPNKEIRMALSSHTGVPFKNIQVWFQNRRAKARAKQEVGILRKLNRSPDYNESGQENNLSSGLYLGSDRSELPNAITNWNMMVSPTTSQPYGPQVIAQQQLQPPRAGPQPVTPLGQQCTVRSPETPGMVIPGMAGPPISPSLKTPSLRTPIVLHTPGIQTPISEEGLKDTPQGSQLEIQIWQQGGGGVVAYQPELKTNGANSSGTSSSTLEPNAFTLAAGSGFLKRTRRPPRISNPYVVRKETRIRSATDAQFNVSASTPISHARPLSARSTGGLGSKLLHHGSSSRLSRSSSLAANEEEKEKGGADEDLELFEESTPSLFVDDGESVRPSSFSTQLSTMVDENAEGKEEEMTQLEPQSQAAAEPQHLILSGKPPKSPVEVDSVTSSNSSEFITELADIVGEGNMHVQLEINDDRLSPDFFELWRISEADEANLVAPYIKTETDAAFWEAA